MEHDFLKKHKFQFVNYCYVYHEKRIIKSPVQINDDSHILHIIKGSGTMYIGSETYQLKRGVVLAIPPFVSFYADSEPDFEMQNIHYRIWLENGELLDNVARLPISFSPEYFPYCIKTLEQMKKVMHTNHSNANLPVGAYEIVLKHLTSNELFFNPTNFADSGMNKIYKVLQSPDCIKYDADKLTRLCFLSVSQMNRKFRQYFKMSPHLFWQKNKLKFICTALKQNNKSLAEIASAFSFTEQTYFSKWFKKMTGISPAEYRKNAKNNMDFLI